MENSKNEQFFFVRKHNFLSVLASKEPKYHIQINQTVATYVEKISILQIIRTIYYQFFLTENNKNTFFRATIARQKTVFRYF